MRRLVVEALSGPVVERICDFIELLLGVVGKRAALGDVLANEAVMVFVEPALPGSMRLGEVTTRACGLSDRLVAAEFRAVVQSQGACRELSQSAGDCLADQLARAFGDLED